MSNIIITYVVEVVVWYCVYSKRIYMTVYSIRNTQQYNIFYVYVYCIVDNIEFAAFMVYLLYIYEYFIV